MNLSSLNPVLPWLLLFWQSAPPEAAPGSHFRYQRAVMLPIGSELTSAQTCAVLDADVFAHAAPSLKDLRLYSGRPEIPYAITLSEPVQQESDDARIFNLRSKSGHILFDLEMPHRPYTGLSLDLASRDYVAKAVVSGSSAAKAEELNQLGTFSLFDLTSQHLSHATDIPLPESTFAYLHVDLTLSSAPGTGIKLLSLPTIIKAATVPPSREGQSLYTTTQRIVALQRGQESVATFKVQSRVPIERISFSLPPSYKGNFSRAVRIEARGLPGGEVPNSSGNPLSLETVNGSILRVHKSEAGQELTAENLSIPVSIGSNMQQPAVVEVEVEDGLEAPLPISVELQMRQRRICFDTRSAAAPPILYYGDPSLDAPAYTDAALKQAAALPRIAALGRETQNSFFAAPVPSRKLAQHRPVLRWIALLGCVCIFALLVIRRSVRHRH